MKIDSYYNEKVLPELLTMKINLYEREIIKQLIYLAYKNGCVDTLRKELEECRATTTELKEHLK